MIVYVYIDSHKSCLPPWRFNSLTIIAVVDSAAQRELLRWNHELNELLRSHDIPVLVQREDQMLEKISAGRVKLGKNERLKLV